MGAIEVERFLSFLVNERHVASSIQNQALSVILFLYREVLALELFDMDGFRITSIPRSRCESKTGDTHIARSLNKIIPNSSVTSSIRAPCCFINRAVFWRRLHEPAMFHVYQTSSLVFGAGALPR